MGLHEGLLDHRLIFFARRMYCRHMWCTCVESGPRVGSVWGNGDQVGTRHVSSAWHLGPRTSLCLHHDHVAWMDEYDPSHLSHDVWRSSMRADSHHLQATRHCNVIQTSRALPFPSSPSLSIIVLRCPSLFIVVHHFLHRCLSISSSWFIDVRRWCVSCRWCGSAFGWIGTSLRFRLEAPSVSHLQSNRQWIPFETHPSSAEETTPTSTIHMDDRAHARLAPPLAKRKTAQEGGNQEGDLQFALPAVEDVRGRSVRHVGISCNTS